MANGVAGEGWIGLIGGLGVGSTIYYYERLTRAFAAQGRPARLLIAHADMNHVLEAARKGDRAGMAEYLAALIGRLKNAGADLAAVPAVMPHMCIHELKERSPLPLMDLIEVIRAELQARELRRVALFGARYVVESGMFGQLQGIELVTPTAEEIGIIHDTYFQIAGSGTSNKAQYETLRNLAHALLDRGAEAIVLAGTDLSLVFNEANLDFPYVDCAQLHVHALTAA